MCSGIGEIDGMTFIEEEKKFLESLKEERDKKDSEKLEKIDYTIDDNKYSIEKIISSNEK